MIGTYLLVLFAFQRADALVQGVREGASIAFGAAVGFVGLGEPLPRQKQLGLLCILAGVLAIKLPA